MSLLWSQAVKQRMEPVEHILRNYQPTDGKTWRDVHELTDWDHPIQQAFVNDIKRNGVREPIPINRENTPPTVEDGHTRVLAAYRAGVKHVPVKDHDPDEWLYAISRRM